MTCRHVLELVEPIAAGDVHPDAAVRAHLESCPSCASALAAARRIETLLADRPAPEAPARFAAAVHQRIRRDRWQTEQHVDRIFNVAIGVAALLVIAGGAFLLNFTAVLESRDVLVEALAQVSQTAVRDIQPWIGTYVAATALLITGLGMWWWAEA